VTLSTSVSPRALTSPFATFRGKMLQFLGQRNISGQVRGKVRRVRERVTLSKIRSYRRTRFERRQNFFAHIDFRLDCSCWCISMILSRMEQIAIRDPSTLSLPLCRITPKKKVRSPSLSSLSRGDGGREKNGVPFLFFCNPKSGQKYTSNRGSR